MAKKHGVNPFDGDSGIAEALIDAIREGALATRVSKRRATRFYDRIRGKIVKFVEERGEKLGPAAEFLHEEGKDLGVRRLHGDLHDREAARSRTMELQAISEEEDDAPHGGHDGVALQERAVEHGVGRRRPPQGPGRIRRRLAPQGRPELGGGLVAPLQPKLCRDPRLPKLLGQGRLVLAPAHP